MRFLPLGDTALTLELGEGGRRSAQRRAQALAESLARHPPAGVLEVVPAFGAVTVFHNAADGTQLAAIERELRDRARRVKEGRTKRHRLLVVPVCYGGEYGPDLAEVADSAKLRPEEVVTRHTRPEYTVLAVGFTPGFPYLGGLPAKLQVPRRSRPRTAVPAGSVGIGGAMTGIYPQASPGGWNLLGRTPLRLFDGAAEGHPAALRVGDRVRFKVISPEEFDAWK